MPVDLTDRHQQALDIAARFASKSAAEVTLLHVVEIIPGIWPQKEREFYDRIEQATHDHLAKLGRYLAERHVPRREEVIFGDRAHEIVRYATERDVDLIVLSSHASTWETPVPAGAP